MSSRGSHAFRVPLAVFFGLTVLMTFALFRLFLLSARLSDTAFNHRPNENVRYASTLQTSETVK